MKKCSRCGETAETKKFYPSQKHTCKDCSNFYLRQWQENNRDKIRKYTREWMAIHPEVNRRGFKKWYQDNAEKHYEWRIAYAQEDSQRHRAQCYALIEYPEGEVCETEGCFELGERHHDDYSKPYEIRWLCKKHHKLLHKEAKMALVL